MIAPMPEWTENYKSIFFGEYTAADQPLQYRKFVHKSFAGVQAAPPYQSTPTLQEMAFTPYMPPCPGTPVTAATILASCWMSYINATVWSTPPPVPPFSAIALMCFDPASVSAANTALIADLVAEFAIMSSGDAKAAGIAKCFYKASKSLMLMATGTSLPAPVPVPLVVPGLPVL